MSASAELLSRISGSLVALAEGPLAAGATFFWQALGYQSERTLLLSGKGPAAFVDFTAASHSPFRPERAYTDRWEEIRGLFQLQDEDIAANGAGDLFSDTTAIDRSLVKSYLFFALAIKGDKPLTRTELSQICREINRPFPMPVLLLIRQGTGNTATLTLAVQDRRPNKTDAERDVLEKVTLIKDVRLANPHRAHIEILADLHLNRVADEHRPANFDELHKAWRAALDANALNKKFYQELANWYFWARTKVTFPGADGEAAQSQAVIRLITRLIFVWFLREKGLVPEELFRVRELVELVKDFGNPEAPTYYRAILQNLFFATLNAEKDDPIRVRRFATDKRFNGKSEDHGKYDLWRYKALLHDPYQAVALFNKVPFLNGGLFECLPNEDGFSDNLSRAAVIPNTLFFSEKRPCTDCDLNEIYGTKNKRYFVEGLIDLLGHYKFTVDENTPIEEEIALDPELLGKVFENLLASFNPETSMTARKQTGSFYTPREIVDYMVDEALIAYLGTQTGVDAINLRRLTTYNDEPVAEYLSEDEIGNLVKAIDSVKILDPACGSGAFPMGALQKLVFLLRRLDPENGRWKARQVAAARTIPDSKARQAAMDAIERVFAHNNEADYGRKLYLIEECIFGSDVQPIAAQISKLRFFISLVIDQKPDLTAENFGILALPNLETNFVVANSLGSSPKQLPLLSEESEDIRRELKEVRRGFFEARGTDTKKRRIAEDDALRERLRDSLKADGYDSFSANQIADWRPYDTQTHAKFFDPEWMFGMTADGKGDFDIVIANPPYVRHEDIKEQKPFLRAAFPEVFNGTADLYTYFYALAVRLLKPGGTLSFISSNKWFRAGYGENLRGYIAKTCQVKSIIDFGELKVFENAATFPMVFVARKQAATESTWFTVVKSWPVPSLNALIHEVGFQLPRKALNGSDWTLETEENTWRLRQMERVGTPLDSYGKTKVYRGLLTGFNRAFFIDGAKRDELIALDPRSSEIIKPLAVGDDVRRWRIERKDKWLIVTKIGIDIHRYPAIMAHLRQYESELKARQDQGNYYWELRACDYYPAFDAPKIIYPEIAKEPRFTFDETGTYTNNKAFIIVGADQFLLGILNSAAAWKYISAVCSVLGDENAGGRVMLQWANLSKLPIPGALPAQKAAVASIAEYLTFLNSFVGTDLTAPRDGIMRGYFEQILNALAHALYFPEDVVAASVLDLFVAASPPSLNTMPETERLSRLREFFETAYQDANPLRGMLFHMKETGK